MQETQETQVQSLGQEGSPGDENGNPLRYSCLENPVDRRAWWATACGVAKESDTTERINTYIKALHLLFFLKNIPKGYILFQMTFPSGYDLLLSVLCVYVNPRLLILPSGPLSPLVTQ